MTDVDTRLQRALVQCLRYDTHRAKRRHRASHSLSRRLTLAVALLAQMEARHG